jgi:predicted nucleic acid-binding protein
VRVAIDTNVLYYAESIDVDPKNTLAIELLERLRPEETVIPIQVAGELFAVLVKKGRRSRDQARDTVLSWGDHFPLVETSPDVLLVAMSLSMAHQLAIWDAVILAAAADAGCRVLLSEDFHDGFTWAGVTVANPFASVKNPLIARL